MARAAMKSDILRKKFFGETHKFYFCCRPTTTTAKASQVPFWHYLGVLWGTSQLDPSFQIHFFLRFYASRIHPNWSPLRPKFFCALRRSRVC